MVSNSPPVPRILSASFGKLIRNVTSWNSWNPLSAMPMVSRLSRGRLTQSISLSAAPKSHQSCWFSTSLRWSCTRRCRIQTRSRWRVLHSRQMELALWRVEFVGNFTCATWTVQYSTIGMVFGSMPSPFSATIKPSSALTHIIAFAIIASSRATISTWSKSTIQSWRSRWTQRTGWRCWMCRLRAFTCGICVTSASCESSKASCREITQFTRALVASTKVSSPAEAKTIPCIFGTYDVRNRWRLSLDTHELWIASAGILCIRRCSLRVPMTALFGSGDRNLQIASMEVAHWVDQPVAVDHRHLEPHQQPHHHRHSTTIISTMITWEIQTNCRAGIHRINFSPRVFSRVQASSVIFNLPASPATVSKKKKQFFYFIF